jgi:hypothetical protein
LAEEHGIDTVILVRLKHHPEDGQRLVCIAQLAGAKVKAKWDNAGFFWDGEDSGGDRLVPMQGRYQGNYQLGAIAKSAWGNAVAKFTDMEWRWNTNYNLSWTALSGVATTGSLEQKTKLGDATKEVYSVLSNVFDDDTWEITA